MLKKLLRPETCAACRQCCVFDGYDVWDTPVILPEVREKIEALRPETTFLTVGGSARFRLERPDADGLVPCPMLDAAMGCRLGADKPFDCALWPFRVMALDGRIVLAVDPLCDAVSSKPLGEIIAFARDALAKPAFSYAAAHPEAVRPYDLQFPVLLWAADAGDSKIVRYGG